ncbi:MAG: hypothetical protein ABR498_06370 [Candidatus Dormibacteria bacterium]
MNGVDVLGVQLITSCKLVADKARESEAFWTRRGFSDASLPGFIAWHSARIIDWGVNTVVRGVPEVAASGQWHDRVRYDMGHGAGLTAAQADDTAASVTSGDVIEYAAALRDSVRAWLDENAASDLDVVPDLRARNQEHPMYRTADAWDEIKALEGLPAWHFLTRPCISHIRVHAGEVDTLLQVLHDSDQR